MEEWKAEIENFLAQNLKLKLHKDKSKIILLSRGVDFVGFRNFYYFKLLRRRNLRKMLKKVESFEKGKFNYERMIEIFGGWNAYAKWGDCLKLRRKVLGRINASNKLESERISEADF